MTSHSALITSSRAGLRLALALALPLALLAGTGCSKDSDGGSGGSGGGGAGSGGSGGGSGGTGGTGTGGAGTGGAGTGGSAGGTGGTGGGALASYKTCSRDQRHGDFVLTLGDGFTGIERGVVLDGVEPTTRAKVLATIGACRLMQPPDQAPCNTPCSSSQNCVGGQCVAKPVARNLGKVTITGMKVSPLELQNIDNVYTNPASVTLPAIGFDEGANLLLVAAGSGAVSSFTLKGWGVAPMVVPETPLQVESGKAVTLTWTAGRQGPAKVLIDFSVNRHGAVDSWVECEVDDSGSFVVDAALTTELFKYGVSGFPSVRLTRQSGDTTTVGGGCVQFLVSATADRELQVPGVVSCQDDDACTPPKKCAIDLTCK